MRYQAKKLHKILFGILFLMMLNSLYLFLANRNVSPPRSEFAGFFYLSNVVLHLALGIFLLIPLSIISVRFLRSIFSRGDSRIAPTLVNVFIALAILTTIICLGFGIYLLIFGATSPHRQALTIHTIFAAIVPILSAASIYLLARRYQTSEQLQWAWKVSRVAVGVTAVLGTMFLGILAMQSEPQKLIANPPLPPKTPFEEGDGKEGRFFPSSAQTAHKGFFPSEYFTDSQSCGKAGCHPDIYKQWSSSMHHFSSFNNQWYRKSIEYMQQVIGAQSSKWCGGCHDQAVLLTEMPNTGKSRMDFPIKDQIHTPEAQAGIGCAVCHSIVHVKSTMGQGDYLADYPPMHKYAISKNKFFKSMHNFLILRAPQPHKKTFLKPFHRKDTAKFCSSCHKVHLDVPVNNYRWLRGFNEFDAWQISGVSGQGARAFYYPLNPDGSYAFKKCTDCHMPLVKSSDAGNIDGSVHSHRFPAANTAVSFVNLDNEQMETTKKILTDGAVTLDIFAIKRPKKKLPTLPTLPTLEKKFQESQEPQASSLFEDQSPSGGRPSIPNRPISEEEEIIALLDKTAPQLIRGEEVIFDVVARTRKLGHPFPGGTIDAFDVWLELKITDENGKTIFWSGGLESPNGPVDQNAHFYRAFLLDAHGNPINKRNAWAARSRLYSRVIPPGAADTVHFRVKIPEDGGDQLSITAKLNYRKFSWYNTQFAFAGRTPTDSKDGKLNGMAIGFNKSGVRNVGNPLVSPHWDDRNWLFDNSTSDVSGSIKAVPKLPIIVVAEKTIQLHVAGANTRFAPTIENGKSKNVGANLVFAQDVLQDRERWNDYGIGLLLQRDFRGAVEAFGKVIEIAPQWPEGWVNLGRTRLEEGNLQEAKEALETALKLYEKTPNLIYHRARTQFFSGLTLKRLGKYDEAAKTLAEVASVFDRDRFVHNELGRIRFLQRRFEEAIAEFEKTLAIDPEDLTAHYNLMLAYRGKGDKEKAMLHEKFYFRFKADESSTQLLGPYKLKYPWDNNEAQLIHEHR